VFPVVKIGEDPVEKVHRLCPAKFHQDWWTESSMWGENQEISSL